MPNQERSLPRVPAAARWSPATRSVDGPTPSRRPPAGLPEGLPRQARRAQHAPMRGNKPRKLGGILGAALARGSARLVTTGGLARNHGLATCSWRARRGSAHGGMGISRSRRRCKHRCCCTPLGARSCAGAGTSPHRAQVMRTWAVATARGERPLLVPPGGSSATVRLGFVSARSSWPSRCARESCPNPRSCTYRWEPGGNAGRVVGRARAGRPVHAGGGRAGDDILRLAAQAGAGMASARCEGCAAGCRGFPVRIRRGRLRVRELAAGRLRRATDEARAAVAQAADTVSGSRPPTPEMSAAR